MVLSTGLSPMERVLKGQAPCSMEDSSLLERLINFGGLSLMSVDLHQGADPRHARVTFLKIGGPKYPGRVNLGQSLGQIDPGNQASGCQRLGFAYVN